MALKGLIVLVVTPCRLIENYHPSFPTMKLDVLGSSIFKVETEAFVSSKTFVSFYRALYPER